MSRYRSPAFGQGDGSANVELIPHPNDYAGGFYPFALPYETTDFTLPSACKWYWRVKTWNVTLGYTDTSSGSYFAPMSFNDQLVSNLGDVDEVELVGGGDIINGDPGARHRVFANTVTTYGSVIDDYGPPVHGISIRFSIGSFGVLDNTPPTLDELFAQRLDGGVCPRIALEVSFNFRAGEDDTLSVVGVSTLPGGSPDPFAITLDGLSFTGAADDPLHTDTLSIAIHPAAFWTWDGIWDGATGVALLDPRA